MYHRKKDIFNQPTIESAKEVILTNWVKSSKERWQIEAPEIVSTLKEIIDRDSVVCDFGIGIGRITKPLLEEMPDIRIVGVDAAESMLRYCKDYVPNEYHNRLELLDAKDMNNLSDKSIDFIFSIYVFQHILANEFEDAVKQLHRILNPEGFLYLLNTDKFRAVPMGRPTWYNDKFPQKKVINDYFEEIRDIPYQTDYMKEILKTHFSKLFRPK